MALHKTATASSVHARAHAPANAVDDDPVIHWSSTFTDPAWLWQNQSPSKPVP
ncbi:MAG: hypothetical protein ACYC35_21310 [Pirellulales bacterium]